MKDTLIVIPTYNEIDNIGLLIHDIFRIAKDVDILVVDDDSPDNTSGLVTDLQNKFIGKLFLLVRKSKIGLGKAYVDGFKWSSGIYFGDIKPYTLFDVHLGYEFTKNLKANFTITNLLNHRHTQIIGGPSLGRVMLLRLQTTF